MTVSQTISVPHPQQQAGASLDSYLSAGHRMMDVRSPAEFAGNTMKQATNLPLTDVCSLMETLDK